MQTKRVSRVSEESVFLRKPEKSLDEVVSKRQLKKMMTWVASHVTEKRVNTAKENIRGAHRPKTHDHKFILGVRGKEKCEHCGRYRSQG